MHSYGAAVGLEMNIMVFAALGGYLLASRICQPSVVGQQSISLFEPASS